MKLTFKEMNNLGHESVCSYCRQLVNEKTKETELEVYRGDMLCLKVNSILEASKLEPLNEGGFRVYNAR